MGFEVRVREMNSAADKLAAAPSPRLDAEGAPNVGGTDGASGYAADYGVWLETRKLDLSAGDKQIDDVVAKIKDAARGYHDTDQNAREVYLKALDNSFGKIDR